MVPYLDLCHYDSDKSYYGRRWAYPKLWEALKTGGIFISDDIQDNWAFKEFCVSQRMSQVDGFRLAFKLMKEHFEAEDK